MCLDTAIIRVLHHVHHFRLLLFCSLHLKEKEYLLVQIDTYSRFIRYRDGISLPIRTVYLPIHPKLAPLPACNAIKVWRDDDKQYRTSSTDVGVHPQLYLCDCRTKQVHYLRDEIVTPITTALFLRVYGKF